MKTMRLLWTSAFVITAGVLWSCSDDTGFAPDTPDAVAVQTLMREDGNNPDEAIFDDLPSHAQYAGYLYVAGNESGTNQIYMYRHNPEGHLTFVGTVPSGGSGNDMPLGSQGAIVMSTDRNYLFAVNSKSNSISSFKIGADGKPMLLHTIGSGGEMPVSLTFDHNRLYVAHAGDGLINGFAIDQNGKLTHIRGSEQKLSSENASPGQIAFSPNGRYLYATEKKTNKISALRIDENGAAAPAVHLGSVGDTPFAFNFARDDYMIVSNSNLGFENAASVTSYTGFNFGALVAANGAVANDQTASGWIASTAYGRFAYVTNSGSDNLSSYYIGQGGKLYLVDGDIKSGDSPVDIAIASNNYHVFVLSGVDRSIHEYARTPMGGLTHIGRIKGIPASASGMASW